MFPEKPVCWSRSNSKKRIWTMNWFQIGKRVCQGYILPPWLFNLNAEYIIWNAGLDDSQAGIKIAGRNINNLRYADDTTLMAENELKSLLMKVKEESEKIGLKGIWSHHFMANRWGNSGNSNRLYFGAPKSLQIVTAAMKFREACSLEEKLWPT